MKSHRLVCKINCKLSLPVRGAWIEMDALSKRRENRRSRSPCGERGLKSSDGTHLAMQTCRSPCGERGLK